MRWLAAVAAVGLVAGVGGAADDKFVPLFNGKDLTGWEVKEGKPEYWTVKDGILTCKAGSGWLGTKATYGDFVLRLEWRIPEGGNSGVFLRVPGPVPKMSPSQTGVEIQILDDNSPRYKGKIKPYQYSGSIYTFVAPSKEMFKGAGQWNRYEITCKGDVITVVYNGEQVSQADASKLPALAKRPKKGYIGLQNHGSGVEFRNIEIKVLEK